MTQNTETLSFFERFQKPVTRRNAMVTFCTAFGAAVLAIVPSFLKLAAPHLTQAQRAEEPRQAFKPASKLPTKVTRHPGPHW